MKVKATLSHEKIKSVFLDGVWYEVGKPLELELDQALRYKRITSLNYHITSKGIYNPDLYKKEKIFAFTGDADSMSGFGNCTVALLKNSLEQGYDVRWIGRNNQVPSLRKAEKLPVTEDMAMIYHEQPKDEWLTSPFGKNIAIVPFETTRIPASWVSKINAMDALLVISDQNEKMMRDSGVTIPISKIKWGVDKNKFDYYEREDDDIFTFGQTGALSERKGSDLLVKAFITAFPPYQFPKVRLLLKSSYNIFKWGVKNDQRVQILLNPMEFSEYKKRFWDKVDAFVWPTRGEGWGLPAMEAMMTGLPVIATNWSGTKEFTTPDTFIPLDNYKMVPAKDFTEKLYKEDCGDWAEPDLNELVEKMRWIYYHQEEAREIGKRAHEHIEKNFLWEDAVADFHKKLKKYL